MVLKLIWAPDFFGPQEIWSPRENHCTAFSYRAQISMDPNLKMEALKLHLLYCTAEEQSLFPWGKKRNCEMRNQSNYLTTLSLSRFLYNLTLQMVCVPMP